MAEGTIKKLTDKGFGCRATIRVRGQGDGNRPTSWCPECQR